jgi:hypothetical protein
VPVRTNALSRNIEAALQIAGVPHRVLKGKRFFERVEVGLSSLPICVCFHADRTQIKDLLAYLQLVDNAAYLPAFMRTVNTPPRQLGEKVRVFFVLIHLRRCLTYASYVVRRTGCRARRGGGNLRACGMRGHLRRAHGRLQAGRAEEGRAVCGGHPRTAQARRGRKPLPLTIYALR